MDTGIFTEKFFEKYGRRNDKPALFFSPGWVNVGGMFLGGIRIAE
jgi:hypothetical protein